MFNDGFSSGMKEEETPKDRYAPGIAGKMRN